MESLQALLCRASEHEPEESTPSLRRRDLLTGSAGLAAAQVLSSGVIATAGWAAPAVAGTITPLEATELGRTGETLMSWPLRTSEVVQALVPIV